ncbi:MAG: caspase family protein [Planctomycetes bacterium]|nr:caspase family protein [Planctomycetota bacterium]
MTAVGRLVLALLVALATGCSGTRAVVKLDDDPRTRAIRAKAPPFLDYKVSVLPLPAFDHATLNITRTSKPEVYSLGLDRQSFDKFTREKFREEFIQLLSDHKVFTRVQELGNPNDTAFQGDKLDERDIKDNYLEQAWEAEDDVVITLRVTRIDCVFLDHQYTAMNYFLWFMFWAPHLFIPDEIFGAEIEVQAQFWSVHTKESLGNITWRGTSKFAMTDRERGWLYMGTVPGWTSMKESNWQEVHQRVMPLAMDDLKANILSYFQLEAEELATARADRLFRDEVIRTAQAPQEAGQPDFRSTEAAPEFHVKMSKRMAMVVGVSEHQDSKIPSLNFAARDAGDMEAFFKDPEKGAARDKSIWLRQNANATKANILADLEAMAHRALPDDQVFIYFAGYAATLPPTEELLQQGITERTFLVAHDTELDKLEETAISVELELALALSNIKAERLILVLDTSFNGTEAGRCLTHKVATVDLIPAEQIFEEGLRTRISDRPNMIQITSNLSGENAYEHENFSHGVFTYYLLEAATPVEGVAPGDRDGEHGVTLLEAYEYARTHVEELTLTQGFTQRPYAVAREGLMAEIGLKLETAR